MPARTIVIVEILVAALACSKDSEPPAAPPTVTVPAAAPAPPQAPQPIREISASKLAKIDSWPPGPVCTCGFVQSFSRPTGDVLVGTIFVSEKPGIPRDNEVDHAAICWWKSDGPATGPAPIHERQRICVKGDYQAPMIKDCKVVPSCG